MSYTCYKCKVTFSGFPVRSIFTGGDLCFKCDKTERAMNKVRFR